MRTKNLNLKKKIAFIASVAMIATTASYLPAGTFTASATPAFSTTFTGKGLYDKADAAQSGKETEIDTVDVFVKINNKYLSVKRTTVSGTPEYKLTNTPDLSDNGDYQPVLANEALAAMATKKLFKKGTDPFGARDNGSPSLTQSASYDVITVDKDEAVKDALELPYFADATEVELEFKAKKKAALGKNSVESITIPLNKYGMGKVAKQNEYVIGKSDASNFDEDKKEFKAKQAGAYEVIDFSGLVVSMTNVGNEEKAIGTASVTATKEGTAAEKTITGVTFSPVGSKVTIEEEEKIEADTYGVEKINGVYAKVLTATLGTAVGPDAVIKIDTGVNGNWKASGPNVNSSTGVLTIGMDVSKDGVAESGLVTMTQGNNKEYYKFVVRNPKMALENSSTKDFGGKLAFDVADLRGEASSAKTATANNNGQVGVDGLKFDGDYKIERKTVVEKLKKADGEKNEFITKYTVYNNAIDDKYKDNAKVTITLSDVSKNGTFKLASERKYSSTDPSKAVLSWGTGTSENKTTINAASTDQTVDLELSSAGTGTTAVLDWVDSTGAAKVATFIIEFKNEYELKYDNEWEDNREDNTKEYDGKVTVTDGKRFSNPGNVDRPGFEFKGWRTNNEQNGGEEETDPKKEADIYAYSVNAGSEQIEGTVITPNTKLHATYKGLRYNVEMSANGGYFDSTAKVANGALTTYEYYAGLDSKQATIQSISQEERKTQNGEIAAWKSVKPTRVGYTFKGWSTEANATDTMTVKQLAAKFPGEGKTLNVYAVWEAKDITANFRYFPFNTSGSAETMDGKFEGTNGVKTAWEAAADNTAKFEKAADGYVTLRTGEKVGDLPTPYLAGYEFEGWYFAEFSNNLSSVSATKVTADTVLDAAMFADPGEFGKNTHGKSVVSDDVYLYAKFVPKTYKISFDIGDGLWSTTDFNDDEEGVIPATVAKNNNSAGKFIYRRADGSQLPDNWAANLGTTANPMVGDGKFITFKNWTINGGTKTYTDLKAVQKAIEDMDKFDDIVVKANYENKTNPNASIFLNANEGAIYSYRTDEKDPTTKKPTSFLTGVDYEHYTYDANVTDSDTKLADFKYKLKATGSTEKTYTIYTKDNTYRVYDSTTAESESNSEEVFAAFVAAQVYTTASFENPGYAFAVASAGTKVSDNYKIDGAYIEHEGTNEGFVVARPGYEFTGWYTDKECTQKYTFGVYPDKGTQTILFAGWKASSDVRYWLAYDLFDGSNSEASDRDVYKMTEKGNEVPNSLSNMKYVRTMMGTAGENVNAKDAVIKVKDGSGTQASYTDFVFDPTLSKSLDTTEKELECKFSVAGLKNGKFEQAQPYTLIEGRYMEKGYQSQDPEEVKELGNATNVKGTANGDKVTISFKAADNAKQYQVCKIVNGKKYYTAKTDKTSIDITPASVDYQVYVIAFDETGKKSTHSETIKLTGVKKYNLGTVMDPKVTETVEGDKKTATVTWSKVEGATWYKVFKMVGGKKFWGKKVTDPSYVLKDIPKADSYIIYVAAGDDKGHVTYGARKKITKYPAVTNVKLAEDNKTVTFNKAEGAVSYQVAKVYADNTVKYSKKSSSNTIVLGNAAKAGQKLYVLAFFTGEDGKTYSSYSDTIEVK